MKETKYGVISHTHWDREWYLPLEQFKLRLVQMFDHLLEILAEYPDYRFHLDGQTIVLDDYLSVRPSKRALLEQYIKDGRILVGPWYVQNDFYLASGEATVRNLLIGTKTANQFGKCTHIGYMADQFGVMAQLPQIYAGFGIDNCIFARGYFTEKKPLEFYWNSQDGSSVLCEYMAFWYNNAQRFSQDIDVSMKMLKHIDDVMRPRVKTSNYFLLNGVDHLEAEEDLFPILEKMQKNLPAHSTILQDTMPEFIARVKAELAQQNISLETYQGEMRLGGEESVLTGTLSTRIYLKQQNVACQTLLENKVEPVQSLLSTMRIENYPHDTLAYTWKILLENHAHDSICGCSTDEVHAHMEDRFMRVDEIGRDMLYQASTLLAEYMDKTDLPENHYLITLLNTTQETQTGTVEARVIIPQEEAVTNFKLLDHDKNEVPFVCLAQHKKAERILSPINLPGVLDVDEFIIKIKLKSLKGLSYQALELVPCDGYFASLPHAGQDTIMENEYLLVKINPNGSINLTNKETGTCYSSLLLLEDNLDNIGNPYIYGNVNQSKAVTSQNACAAVEMIEESALSSVRQVSFAFAPLATGTQDAMPVTLLLTLDKGSKLLKTQIKLDNRTKYHRTRLLVPTGLESDSNYAGDPFNCIRRKASNNPLYARNPNIGFVCVENKNEGLAVFNHALYEYEQQTDAQNTLAFTLVRACPWFENAYDPMRIDKTVKTEDKNQCQGEITHEIALYPYAGDHLTAQVAIKAKSFACPPFTAFAPVNRHKFSGGRPFIQDSTLKHTYHRPLKHPHITLPREFTFAELCGEGANCMVLSAIKQSENGAQQIVRLYNTSDTTTSFALNYCKKITALQRCNLDETPKEELSFTGHQTQTICVAPKEIVTLAIQSKQQ